MNYLQIKAAIQSWLHDGSAEVLALLDTFILMAEARMNRDLDAPILNKTVTGTLATAISLPADFSGLVSLNKVISSTIKQPILPMTSSQIDQGGFGYCLSAEGIKISPYVTGSYEFVYASTLPSIVTNSTNAISASHPDLYLYACLIEASAYTRDEKEQFYIGKYENILNAVNINESHLGQYLAQRSDINVP